MLWNQLALPAIEDKLTIGSEIAVKLLVPFLGACDVPFLLSGALISRLLLALTTLLTRLPRLSRHLQPRSRQGRLRGVLDGQLGHHVCSRIRHGDPLFVARAIILPVLLAVLGHSERECLVRTRLAGSKLTEQVSVAFLDIADMAAFYGYG